MNDLPHCFYQPLEEQRSVEQFKRRFSDAAGKVDPDVRTVGPSPLV
jgi:hypothetical protein